VDSVEMRGTIRPDAVEDYLNGSDFLIQTSLRELGSYSLLEAMSCGVVPVVTDIPLFRVLTDSGRLGLLFPIGDHACLAERVLQFDLRTLAEFSQQIREAFEQSFSYDSIARTYEAAFRSGLARYSGPRRAVAPQ
jgi:glycosyltransferase involved in cell wall biosynthesis